jgi:putative FmdB family regulatory protein
MPTYEYECEDGHRWEDQRPMDARRDPIECPECSKDGEMVYSVTLEHVWDERSARDIHTRSSSKEIHTGITENGRPFRTIGGPPPKGI